MKSFRTIYWSKIIRASTAATAVFDRCDDKNVMKKDLDDKFSELIIQQNRIMEINIRILKNELKKNCLTSRLQSLKPVSLYAMPDSNNSLIK